MDDEWLKGDRLTSDVICSRGTLHIIKLMNGYSRYQSMAQRHDADMLQEAH